MELGPDARGGKSRSLSPKRRRLKSNNEHYFAIFIPVGEGSGNKAKAQASDFNSAFYASKGLKVTSNLIDRSTQVVW